MNKFKLDGPISDAMLDRLVDGELSESERRSVILRLDGEPDGWRRCALVFLEAQAWRDAFATNAPPPSHETQPIQLQSASWGWQHVLAMAACVMVALSAGLWFGQQGTPLSGPTHAHVAAGITPSPAVPMSAAQAPDDREAHRRDGKLRLVVDRNAEGGPRYVDVPVMEDGQPMTGIWGDRSQLVPPAVAQALQRSGREVRRHRELWPVRDSEGRQFVVPADRVDVQYVGHRSVL